MALELTITSRSQKAPLLLLSIQNHMCGQGVVDKQWNVLSYDISGSDTYDIKWLAPTESNPVTMIEAFGSIWVALEQRYYTDPTTVLQINPETMDYETYSWTTDLGTEYRCTSLVDFGRYMYISGYCAPDSTLPFEVKKMKVR